MKTGKEYTVDSRNGIIYEGIIAQASQPLSVEWIGCHHAGAEVGTGNGY